MLVLNAQLARYFQTEYYQKQPREVFCRKKNVLLKISHIFHRKILVLESLFNKVADLRACNFTKMRPQHSYFSVKIAKFL